MSLQQIRNSADRVRTIPLRAVLLESGAQPDRYDQAKWHTVQGTISCTSTKFINWNRNIAGGGAIDLVMHLNNLDFKSAVQWLCRHFPDFDREEETNPCAAASLVLPPPDGTKLAPVNHYLVHHRALPASMVQSLIASHRLYADSRGNAVFLLLGKENQPVGAELRGTTSARWRGMAPGSRKDWGYFSIPNPGATAIVLCESAIDAISCFVLHPDHLCISTSGARANPAWLPFLIHQGYEIYCGFDSDPTGDTMASAMIALYSMVKRLRPAQHDWNDILKSRSPWSATCGPAP